MFFGEGVRGGEGFDAVLCRRRVSVFVVGWEKKRGNLRDELVTTLYRRKKRHYDFLTM